MNTYIHRALGTYVHRAPSQCNHAGTNFQLQCLQIWNKQLPCSRDNFVRYSFVVRQHKFQVIVVGLKLFLLQLLSTIDELYLGIRDS